jgi:hypothetical protein
MRATATPHNGGWLVIDCEFGFTICRSERIPMVFNTRDNAVRYIEDQGWTLCTVSAQQCRSNISTESDQVLHLVTECDIIDA